jgi:hypothetical protein
MDSSLCADTSKHYCGVSDELCYTSTCHQPANRSKTHFTRQTRQSTCTKPTKTRTRVHGYGFWWVRVRVDPQVPAGLPVVLPTSICSLWTYSSPSNPWLSFTLLILWPDSSLLHNFIILLLFFSLIIIHLITTYFVTPNNSVVLTSTVYYPLLSYSLQLD